MRIPTLIGMIAGAIVVLGSGVVAPDQRIASPEQAHATGSTGPGHYAQVDGLRMYYEVHGTGQPIVLIHGGLTGVIDFAQLMPLLAKTREVIAVELQGHGHTADINRPLSYELMADDIAALIRQLGLGKADVLGYSLGGDVALQTAIRHPGVVRKLVLISTVYKRSGWYAASLAQEQDSLNASGARALMPTPIYQYYARVAPKPADWTAFVIKVGQFLKQDFDWSKAVAAMKTPTLIVVGDGDRVRPEHALAMVRLLGGGRMDGGASGPPMGRTSAAPTAQLAILPGTTHFSILSRVDLLMPVLTPFLDAPMPAAT